MNKLEMEYLRRNGFKKVADGTYVTTVIGDAKEGEFFTDRKQSALIKLWFESSKDGIQEMKIEVREINAYEFDVSLLWSTMKDGEVIHHKSVIGGEDLYDQVSQAIVLADVENL